MHSILFLLLFFPYYQSREQGPPPEDSGLFSQYEYYYDVYINETTILLPDLDPKYDVFQGIYISGTLKITQRELKLFFQKIASLRYGIRIDNTNLLNLSFLKLYSVDPLDNSKNSIEITNNQNLTSIGIDFEYCVFCTGSILISNNSKLDLKNECDGIIMRYSSYRTITENLADCGCMINGNFNKYISTLKSNCWMLIGNVTIDQNSEISILNEKMSNVTRISGGLSIINTNFTDLSFLSSVEWVEINAYKTQYLASIEILNNTNLLSLNMTAKRDGLYLTIRNNPKLCITPQELDNLFYGLSLDSNLDINVCYDNDTPSYWCDVPASGNFKDLPDGCVNITGDLVLDEQFDFANSYKLYDIENIYGSLTIRNTKLRSLNMIPLITNIRSIKDNVIPIHVYNNSNINEFYESDQIKLVESGMPVTIENNTILEVSQRMCTYFKTRKDTVIRNNKLDCYEGYRVIPKRKNDKTPLNVDVFKGVPVYLGVFHSDHPDGSGLQNNPWDRNTTDSDYEYYEGDLIQTTTQSGLCKISSLTIFIFVAMFFV